MTQSRGPKNGHIELRRRAESILAEKAGNTSDLSTWCTEDVHKLVHELQVHQTQLEMQNEELRRAQIEVEELKDRYLDLYDFAPVGYVTLNEKGLVLEANLTAARLLGVDRQALLKGPFARFICNGFKDTFHLHFHRVLETQSKQTCEIELKRNNGAQFHAQLESVAVQDENGQFIQVRTVFLDITDRKRVEETLGRNERLSLVLNASTDGFWDWDIVAGHVWRSDGWTRILGYTLEETEPDIPAWDKLIHPDDLPQVMKNIDDHLAGLTSGYTNEYRLLKKSGEWTWVQDRGKVVERDDSGRPLRARQAHFTIFQVERKLRRPS